MGSPDGDRLGLNEGTLEGRRDGLEDGLLLGFIDGGLVEDGDWLGSVEGLSDGD